MIACPKLIPGTDYQVTDRWALVMAARASTPLPLDCAPVNFLTGDQRLAHWDGEQLHIEPGYACDGYSPVFRLFGRWIRITPTPVAGLWPAVFHDVLRQFLGVPNCPWTRRNTDAWFYDALITGGLHRHHAGLYHGAVAGPAGDAWIKLTRKPDPRLCIRPL